MEIKHTAVDTDDKTDESDKTDENDKTEEVTDENTTIE